MLNSIVRFIKRFLILIPGIVVTYFAVSDLYPVIDRRFPAAMAVLFTYILTAYVLIPAVIRLLRILIRPKHIPLYCVTPDGFASDPVNVGIIGTEIQLITAMTQAGWHQSDPRTIRNIVRMIRATLLKTPYLTAPFSTLYLFGRRQDLGFQLPINKDPSNRHHVRFWAVESVEDKAHHEHVKFWQKYHVASSDERVLWVGAASRDIGIAPIRHNAQITHLIHPDTNAEREMIVRQLKATGFVVKHKTITAGRPYQLRNRAWSGYFNADGTLTILELKE